MPAKKLIFDTDARLCLLRGTAQLSRAVKITLGPRGRNVIVEKRFGSPIVSKDGASVAESVDLADPGENLGARLVREAASRTSEHAGDGTTTATLLAEAIYQESIIHLAAGANPIAIHRGIQKGAAVAVAFLKSISKPVKSREEIRQVATASANWDSSIGEVLAHAMDKVGENGVISVEEGRSMDTTIDFVEGMQFDRGYISSYFANIPDTLISKLEAPRILICEGIIQSMKELFPILEKVATARVSLLIIAEDVTGEALSTLVVNHLRGTIRVCAVKAPGFGPRRRGMLEDVAILTGGKFISGDLGISLGSVTLEDLGRAESAEINHEKTTLVGGAGKKSELQSRINQLRREIEETSADYDKQHLQERLARLSAGAAVIRVGATTESEMKEKKSRFDDALSATRAAMKEGVLPGGGVALIRCIPALESNPPEEPDEQIGFNIIKRAMEEPARVLSRNAGADGSLVVREIARGKGGYGYNVLTRTFEDLQAAGVVDPLRVTRTALESAASIAGLMLTTGCVVAERKV